MVSRSRNRVGASAFGCLLSVAVLAAAGFIAFEAAQPYQRFYRLRDRMRFEAGVAQQRSDAEIRRRLASFGDSLGLSGEDLGLKVRRGRGQIRLTARYEDTIAVSAFVRPVAFEVDEVRRF